MELRFITVFILLLRFIGFSQWMNIPLPTNPMLPAYGTPIYNGFPEKVLPLKNEKIMYCGSLKMTPSGGSTSEIFFGDDYGKLKRVYSYQSGTGGNTNFNYVTAFNDSVCAFDAKLYSNCTYGTINNFIATSGDCRGNFNFLSNAVTPNFLYYICFENGFFDNVYLQRRKHGSGNSELMLHLPDIYASYNITSRINENFTFINDSVGFVLFKHKHNLNKTVLMGTKNRGNSWDVLHTDSVSQITSYSFPTNNTGYLAKTNGSILKTTDGGTNWISVNSLLTASISCIRFGSDSVGYVGAANGYLAKTINSGISWIQENSNTTNTIKNIYIFDSVVYFSTNIVGDGLYKNVILPNPIRELNDLYNVYPNPTQGLIHIDLKLGQEGMADVSLNDLNGRMLMITNFNINDGSLDLDLRILPNGVYILTIKTENSIWRKKLVITK